MGHPAADIFFRVAELLRNDPAREGNLLRLGGPRRVVLAGDLHGNRENLARILQSVAAREPRPTLILQEIIHGPTDAEGFDRSAEVMLRAAQCKLDHPEEVCFLMGNHNLAQATGNEITKGGRGVCKAFARSVRHGFGESGEEVLDAIEAFCRSLPLAVRFDNGVQASHSLPSPERMELAGTDILTRPLKAADLRRGGAVYEWVWGRDQTPEQLERLAEELGVCFFLLGHRHIQQGMMPISPLAAAINSDGPMGCVVEFDTDEAFDEETLRRGMRRISNL
jgi:hypothetical protein